MLIFCEIALIAFETERFSIDKRGLIVYNVFILGSEDYLMNKKPYSSAIKKTPFKYPIAKKIAKLMLEGKDRKEITQLCCEENYIEIDSPDRRREITNVLYSRLCALDDFLLSEFYNGDVATSKFILIYAIAKTDTLFFEFLFEKYREALLSSERHYLSVGDFDDYFESKKQSDLIVAKWGQYTLECLTKGYRNILVDSGLGRRERKNILVEKMMVHPAVEEHIRLIGDGDFIKAVLGGE